jgi:hypothetical protein
MPERDAIVLDPMLATGHSAIAAVERLKETRPRSIRFVCLVSCPEGIAAFHARIPTCRSTLRPWTASSTIQATSCQGSATPAIASSAPSDAMNAARRSRSASTRLLWLLAFVPAVLAAGALRPDAHTLLFVLSVLAIVPLAALLAHATESVAAKTGDAVGGC